MAFFVVKVRGIVLHFGGHILSIQSLIWELFMSLERSFRSLSSDVGFFSRFHSKNIMFSLLYFCILVDILVVSGMGINFIASDDSS